VYAAPESAEVAFCNRTNVIPGSNITIPGTLVTRSISNPMTKTTVYQPAQPIPPGKCVPVHRFVEGGVLPAKFWVVLIPKNPHGNIGLASSWEILTGNTSHVHTFIAVPTNVTQKTVDGKTVYSYDVMTTILDY
jgi:hypothetical protein